MDKDHKKTYFYNAVALTVLTVLELGVYQMPIAKMSQIVLLFAFAITKMMLVALILLILVFVLTSAKNSLKESLGQETETIPETLISQTNLFLANNINKLFVGLFVMIVVLKFVFDSLMGVGVTTNYQPEQPIAFSHKIHAGDNSIDCNYCHSSARSSKTSGIPSANVCMNCHAHITSGTTTGTAEIQKIYDAIGYDPETRTYIEGYVQKPIEWIKVHNLPDLAYFNHSQHVTVGGLECQQCHGNMQEKTIGQVATIEELNMITFNKKDTIFSWIKLRGLTQAV